MKLTPRQAEVLRQVVRTNGGGLHAGFHERQPITRILRALESKGLVQGKAGMPHRAVHTRAGLEWTRADPGPQPKKEKVPRVH